MSGCRSCHAPVVWARTHAGKPIPLDPEPTPAGNLCYRDDGRIVSDHGFPREAPRYTTHFATCPSASQHRTRS